jgi:hypothetical protein
MEFDYRYDVYHPHPSEWSDHCNTNLAMASEHGNLNTHTLSRHSTMQRYLHESVQPYFTTSLDNNDPSTQAYPAVPHDNRGSMDLCPRDASHQGFSYGSPVGSPLDSAYISSGWSDRTGSPWLSPQVNHIGLSSDFDYRDGTPHDYASHTQLPRNDSFVSGSCVAMHDVQQHADAQPDTVAFDDESFGYNHYASFAQEGYQPIEAREHDHATDTYRDVIDSDIDAPSVEEPEDTKTAVVRSRRTSRTTSASSTTSSARITKRPRANRTSSRQNVNTTEHNHGSPFTASPGPFPCPLAIYGCTANFGNKNEWKRHVASQHMRFALWKCDQCLLMNRRNDFNRKDLYVQHVRRMHAGETGLQESATKKIDQKSPRDSHDELLLHEASVRCYHELRRAPQESCCIFCEEEFHGPTSWDDRMEHIGRHLEVMKRERKHAVDLTTWKEDEAVHEWLVEEDVIVVRGERWVLADTGRRKSTA